MPQKTPLRIAHQRVEDPFESRQGDGIAKHATPESRTVDAAVATDDAGKRGLDGGDGAAIAPQHPVDRGVSIVNGDAKSPEGSGDGRLAHADRAGQAEHDHLDGTVSRNTNSRSSGVTAGSIPNHAAKPGRAWCSSMPSPSTTRLPRPRACASSGVSSGT